MTGTPLKRSDRGQLQDQCYGEINAGPGHPIAATDPFLVRIRKRLSRMLMWLWSASFILLSVLMLYVTYNTISLTL
ncbi:hypothetical protein [Ketobacter sp.]|uniref:hypothetical protein n=1 Tax=Ketobacter sp. TaxID=2083498 RepID=UPI0025C5E845|nr:hypothetical protein [Ketobacter sp.]